MIKYFMKRFRYSHRGKFIKIKVTLQKKLKSLLYYGDEGIFDLFCLKGVVKGVGF